MEPANQFTGKRRAQKTSHPQGGLRYPEEEGYPSSESSVSISSPNPCMSAPAPPFFSAPLRTMYDLPVRGAKDAPKTFYGKYTDIQLFLDHYEHLLNKCRITSDQEKCENLLMYCSIGIQNVIQSMDNFESHKWSKLKRDILRQFDVDRVFQNPKTRISIFVYRQTS
jgi:hypothetical protein